MRLRLAVGVGAAGVIGAAVRWGIATRFDVDWALFAANVLGCGVIGWAVARHEWTEQHRPLASSIRGTSGAAPSPWLTVGFCGALTSMSALALQLAELVDGDQLGTAAAWLSVTIVACTLAFVIGRAVVAIGRGQP